MSEGTVNTIKLKETYQFITSIRKNRMQRKRNNKSSQKQNFKTIIAKPKTKT